MLEAVSAGARLLGFRAEPLILASRSPRRRQLLEMLGVRFRIQSPTVEEGNRRSVESAIDYARRLAGEKARSIGEQDAAHAVLAADTIVEIDHEVLEKPQDVEHARELLRRLSGRWHEVHTAICIRRIGDGRIVDAHESSRVLFAPLDEETIHAYVATGEPMDKAGAYGIQGYGGMLVERIEGCYFNVMGLPIHRLRVSAHQLERT